MPGTSSSSDTYEQLKRAFRNLFRRRKFNTNVPAVAKPQAPARPLRPRSASAVAAPEVFESPEIPSWPIFGQTAQGGGLYCAPVELPGSLAPLLQHRSKSDAGQPVYHSDLFSELDATSIRRLSVIGSEVGDEELNEEYTKLRAELNAQQSPEENTQNEQSTPEPAVDLLHEEQIQKAQTNPESATVETAQTCLEQVDQAQDEQQFQDAEEHLPVTDECDVDVEPVNIALPESSDSEEDLVSSKVEPEELARNDSANGGKVFHDDSSSLYSTDDSDVDVESTTDAATVSTPRTASLLRADMMEYFDEKIPVLCEPPQVTMVAPAPGMAATSGPLEEFSW